MIFCDKCFADKEISYRIRSLSADRRGDCPVCKRRDRFLYDTEIQNELTPSFEELLDIYTPDSSLPKDYPRAECRFLLDDIKERWHIFDNISRQNAYEILISICADLYSNSPALFDGLVGIPELFDPSYLEEHSLLKNNDWDEFVREIKTKNRFHSKQINFEILEKYCSFIRRVYKAGEKFYRARLSEAQGFSTHEMSAPPPGKSSEGRANARGITCLYLANDIATTLHEVRAGVFDYVSVGTFQLKKDIVVVDLRSIAEISPFVEGLDYLDHAINKLHLERLNQEMSKSLRRSDSTLDYVPTQYIVDYIKSIQYGEEPEYAGIVYNSTTNPGGFNLAIFEPTLFDCIDVEVHNIEKLEYTSRKIDG